MAEAATVYAEETAVQSTANTTYTTVKSVTLLANTKYLLKVVAFINGDNVTSLSANAIINIASNDQSGSEVNIEPTSSTSGNYRCYSYLDEYTTGGSNETLSFQIKTSSGDTCEADSIVIDALDLSGLTEGVDYKFGEDDDLASPVANGTTWASRASATFTNPNSGDDWLVLGYVQWNVKDVATIRCEGRINQDSGSAVLPAFSVEGENTSEIRNALLTRVYTLNDTNSHTFALQVQDSGSGTQNEHRLSRIFCLRLNAFETHVSSWDETGFGNGGSTNFAEMGALNPTPATAGNWLIGGTCVMDVRNAGKKASARVQEGGTTLLTGIDSHWMMSGNDNNDDDPCFFFTRENFTASAKDIDFDGRFDSAFDQPTIKYRSFWAFSLELAQSGTALKKITDETEQVSESTEAHLALKRETDETENVSEAVEAHLALKRETDEAEQISESTEAHLSKKREVSETEQISESVSHVLAKKSAVDETETVSESIQATLGKARAVDETEQVTEFVEAHLAQSRRVNESEQISESVEAHRGLKREVSETEQISEAVAFYLSLVRSSNETEEISESVSHVRGTQNTIGETAQISEAVVAVISSQISKEVAESVAINEAVLFYLNLTRSIGETENVSESVEAHLSQARTENESEEIQETIARRLAMARQVQETETISESILALIRKSNGINETENISESVLAVLGGTQVNQNVKLVLSNEPANKILVTNSLVSRCALKDFLANKIKIDEEVL